MSNVVKLASKMPADINLNGVDALVQELLDDPETLRAAVVTFTVQKITETPEDGIKVPTIMLRRIEPIGSADELSEAVSETMLAAAGKRTGREPLPLDTVEVVDETGI